MILTVAVSPPPVPTSNADISVLGVFARVFEEAGKDPGRHKRLAHAMYAYFRAGGLFPVHLDLDDDLGALDLARVTWSRVHRVWVVVYKGDPKYATAQPYDPNYQNADPP